VIVGAVVGALGLVAILAVCGICLSRRRRGMRREDVNSEAAREVYPYALVHSSVPPSASGNNRVGTSALPGAKTDHPSANEDASTAVGVSAPAPPFSTRSKQSEDDSNASTSQSFYVTQSGKGTALSRATTLRQQRLHEREEENAQQLESLQSRIGSSEWTPSRADLETLMAEMTRLREENSWLKDAQQSDWALGLSDELEMPPSYVKTVGIDSGS
jgi:hypothetical protein